MPELHEDDRGGLHDWATETVDYAAFYPPDVSMEDAIEDAKSAVRRCYDVESLEEISTNILDEETLALPDRGERGYTVKVQALIRDTRGDE